jgi:hypothetical protein
MFNHHYWTRQTCEEQRTPMTMKTLLCNTQHKTAKDMQELKYTPDIIKELENETKVVSYDWTMELLPPLCTSCEDEMKTLLITYKARSQPTNISLLSPNLKTTHITIQTIFV